MSDFLSFKLPEDFVEKYKEKPVDWGFPIGPDLSLGEITFLSKYSRKKEDGTKERWHEVCRRVVEGTYSILKDHCANNHTPWYQAKALSAAKDMYERMFVFKWLPPGRGIWGSGTTLVNKENNSANLYNCAFLSTEKLSHHSVFEATFPFVRLMEMSLYGIGVGFDTRGADKLTLNQPSDEIMIYVVPDTREGWAKSLEIQLESFLFKNRKSIEFDYSLIRAEGSPLIRSGGIAPGAGPLIDLHHNIRRLLNKRESEKLSSLDIVDIMTMAGKAVVSGGVRRSALIGLGESTDELFVDAKNWEVNPERMGANGWGHLSNNSVFMKVGDDIDHLLEKIVANGEPGLVYLDLAKNYGRLKDAPRTDDSSIGGVNPCGEIFLSSSELCNLTESFPYKHENIEDYKKTLKSAYLYSKAITLVPTPWEETNETITRNRRIGTSISGVVEYIEKRGWQSLRELCDEGYQYIQVLDEKYSSWLGVRESIRTTCVKPSGSMSTLVGTTPGVHFPVQSGKHLRRQRFNITSPMLAIFEEAGYNIEPDVMDPQFTRVVEFPVEGLDLRSEQDVTVWEKMSIASLMAAEWTDNAVSATFTFRPDEKDEIGPAIEAFEGRLKTMSFLPLGTDTHYQQMPYQAITQEKFDEMRSQLKPIDVNKFYDVTAEEALGEKFCTSDRCEI